MILSETDDLKIDTPQFDNENDFLYDDPNLVTICNLLVPLGNDCTVMTHSIQNEYDNEKLPNAEQFFDENHEIKFEALKKRFTIEDGDFSDCPQKYLKPLKKLLDEFKDRFSTFKLDVEVTDMYTADLETEPGKKVVQKCRRLANHKFQFGFKAIKQLEQAGVV